MHWYLCFGCSLPSHFGRAVELPARAARQFQRQAAIRLGVGHRAAVALAGMAEGQGPPVARAMAARRARQLEQLTFTLQLPATPHALPATRSTPTRPASRKFRGRLSTNRAGKSRE